MSKASLSITLLTLGFIAYQFVISSERLRDGFARRVGQERSLAWWIYFQRLWGLLLYGLVPWVIFSLRGNSLSDFGVKFQSGRETLIWTAGLGAVVVLMNYFVGRTPSNLAMYPQIRMHRWPRSVVVASAVTWVLYLLAYEFMFRGWLFFTCLDAMGPELAIVVNVSLYALVHVPKGFNETVGAIPLGALLCWLTLQTGTIWIAFLVHSIMALSNEWFSMYYTRKVRA